MGELWRTRVFKFADGMWRVDYYWPYAGRLYVDYGTWREAWDEAMDLEAQRVWA